MNNWLFILVSTVSLCSCTYETQIQNDILLAEVYNRKLQLSDLALAGLEFEEKTGADSIQFINAYINKWVQEALILHEAEKNLNETRQIDKLVKNYRSALLIHEYETQLCKTELDTSVSKDELLSFYQKNKQLYQLKSPILRCRFIKIPLIAPDLEEIDDLANHDDAESQILLSDYCIKYAEKYNLDQEKWYRLSELKKILPANNLVDIQHKKSFKIQDSTYLYLFKLLEWVPNNTTAPLEFVEKQATKIILKNRRRQLIEKEKQKLFEAATYNDDVKIFIK